MPYLRAILSCKAIGLVSATLWDHGLDGFLLGEVIAPTETPYAARDLYPDVSFGTAPKSSPGIPKGGHIERSGRLGSRAPTCADPGYMLACPEGENLPCCPPTAPVCCHDPSDVCCFTGTFCVGLRTCCPNGSLACGEGCCNSDQLCCGTQCCNNNEICRNGSCVPRADPAQSYQSVQSIASTRSVASVSDLSIASVLSVASVESIELSISQQYEQSVVSVAAVMSQSRASVSFLSEASVASVASVSSISQAALTTSSTPTEIKPINNGPSKTQVIVGGTIGGGVAAILLVGLTICVCLRRRKSPSPVVIPPTSPPMGQPTYSPGPSPYTGYPGVTPALVYDEPTRPSIAHQSGFGMPMWLEHNNGDTHRRSLSMASSSSPPPGGNMPLYPSNVASFYEPASPHTKVESAIKGEDEKGVEESIDARAAE